MFDPDGIQARLFNSRLQQHKIHRLYGPILVYNINITAINRVFAAFGYDLNFIDHLALIIFDGADEFVLVVKKGVVGNGRNNAAAQIGIRIVGTEIHVLSTIEAESLVVASYLGINHLLPVLIRLPEKQGRARLRKINDAFTCTIQNAPHVANFPAHDLFWRLGKTNIALYISVATVFFHLIAVKLPLLDGSPYDGIGRVFGVGAHHKFAELYCCFLE